MSYKKRNIYSLLFLIMLPYLMGIHDLSYIYNIPMKMNPISKKIVKYDVVSTGNAQFTNARNNGFRLETNSLKVVNIEHYLTCMECENLLSVTFTVHAPYKFFIGNKQLSSLIIINNFTNNVFHPPKHNTLFV